MAPPFGHQPIMELWRNWAVIAIFHLFFGGSVFSC
ncbi:MAG TPA: hypothetical protein DEF41_12890 [Desulfovibrio sp.]|uniref:Uncharacterized protein n=1 Tax=Nitratidesulfovibrio vulgaris (strain ATCC 29579 / DSM 644 / CCUG 34227 / NCIMB 8303 / VKM B-1760 / Hildenborough) TaxID=882 RepID=Q726R8_NITV2|nr:hypothetical protein DVU_3038 [Nitratidesulfovibrio vulgaris str. Hildenborough]HBW16983.1 hypothetical protein [Desulfovibrio sp.]